ncbi:MAG: SEC-C metal-binding domain-containing protein [Acidobacteriota bacterium]|nr:SEC-C metal-binding domain-containing protein [Acidobacteriota bacterium]
MDALEHTPYFRDTPKIGPNDPCQCGSFKMYKKCHGAF